MTKERNQWIGLLPGALPVAEAMAFAQDSRAGAIDLFLGITRAERHQDGRELVALDYEAYAEMADRQLLELAIRAREIWPITKLVLLHRVGRVGLAEPSVLIAVATPHRAEAFDACRFLIDDLKRDVAIWKKEVWTGGDDSWVEAERL